MKIRHTLPLDFHPARAFGSKAQGGRSSAVPNTRTLMTSRQRKILFGVVVCLLLILAVRWLQHRALLQEFSFGQIAYASHDERTSSINSMDTNGAHVAKVKSAVGSTHVCCPAWSQDGHQLAYAVLRYDSMAPINEVSIDFLNPANNQEASVACGQGGEATCNSRGVSSLQWINGDKCFHWISKDSLMFFENTIPATNSIDAQGAHQCKLFAPYLDQYAIGFGQELTDSPDHHYYLKAVYHPRLNKFESFLVSTDGLSTSLGMDFITSFAWSPDAQQLAFSKATPREDTKQALYLVHIADPVTQPLVTDLDVKGNPTWSPDSRWIAFSAAGTDGNIDIYKVNIETKEVTRLTTEPAIDTNPVWRPEP